MNATGIVLYTDGGCSPPSRGIGGYGIHGYTYVQEIPKRGHGCKAGMLTATGYKPRVKSDPCEVEVVQYIDALGNVLGGSTNNEAELLGLIHGLMYCLTIETLTRAHFILDSQYVLKGAEEWLPKWKANNWNKSGGEEIANADHWKTVDTLLGELRAREIEISWEWVKGHSDNVGNTIADELATLAITTGRKGILHERVIINDPKAYWSPEAGYHILLNEPRAYFVLEQRTLRIHDHYCYFLGNPGKNKDGEQRGKRISDAGHSIVMLREPDLGIETIVDICAKLDQSRDGKVREIRLDCIQSGKVFKDITENGDLYLRVGDHRPDLYWRDSSLICQKCEPARLSLVGMEDFIPLIDHLTAFIDNSLPQKSRLTDITDLIYETRQGKKDKIEVVLKVPDEHSFIVEADYHAGDTTQRIALTLTFGLDLPKRRVLGTVASPDTRVYVLTCPEDVGSIRYMCIVKTEDAYGIWSATYANLRLLPVLKKRNRGNDHV